MRKNITYGMVKAWAQSAVAERGEDFVYTNSIYDPTGGKACVNVCEIDGKVVGSCIVGKILLENIGVPAEFFDIPSIVHGSRNGDGILALAPYLQGEYGIDFTPKAMKFLMMIQADQDSGHTWGNSVEMSLTGLQESPEY